MLRPVFDDLKTMKQNLIGRYESDFLKEYSRLQHELYVLEESSMYFIEENYKKVKDWSPLDITIVGYYKKIDSDKYIYDKIRYVDYNFILKSQNREPYLAKPDENVMQRLRREMDEQDRNEHNPILDISDVVIDPSDGDLALKINNKWHTMVSGLCVIELADFIEKSLTQKQ